MQLHIVAQRALDGAMELFEKLSLKSERDNVQTLFHFTSGTPSEGSTMFMISLISRYFKTRSLTYGGYILAQTMGSQKSNLCVSTVVELRLGDALTSISQGFKLLSMMMSYP